MVSDSIVERDFFKKFNWAHKHLHDLEALVADYRATHPYAVTKQVEGKRQREVWRLHITAQPPDEVALVLGDFLFNTRASLEYLAGELVARKERSHAFFPILSERIWDIPISENESQEREANRRRWAFVTRTMTPEVIAIIQKVHPPDGQPKRGEEMNGLRILSGLANKDRHRYLNILATGLDKDDARFTITLADGQIEPGNFSVEYGAFADNAVVDVPQGTVDVQVTGTVAVVVQVSPDWGYARVPDDMRTLWDGVAMLMAHLEPHTKP